MSTRSSVGWLIAVAPVSFLFGSAGGYAVHDQLTEAQVAGLTLEISRLKEVADHPATDRPTDQEATAAIAKSGRSMEVSECKRRQAVPDRRAQSAKPVHKLPLGLCRRYRDVLLDRRRSRLCGHRWGHLHWNHHHNRWNILRIDAAWSAFVREDRRSLGESAMIQDGGIR